MADRDAWFVSTEWLAAHQGDVAVVDGSWHLPTTGRSGRAKYDAAHIPGAVFFDIDTIADTTNPLPHMLPSPAIFAKAVGALGVDEKQTIVVYDGAGLSAAPRLWWTFKVMGARDVVILEGGLPKWRAEGRPVDAAPVTRAARTFVTQFDPHVVIGLIDVRDGLLADEFQVVDARPPARFLGGAPEPRPWVKTGRIPGSRNVPSTELVADGKLKDRETLRRIFIDAGADLTKPIVTSCGSGVTAATVSLALDMLGVKGTRLYDGSWTEWGARADLPIETGKAG